MLRLYDFECTECEVKRDALIEKEFGGKAPKHVTLHCGECAADTDHIRIMSIPAHYLGERDLSPAMSGGRYDTMGHARLPEIPDLPGAKEHDRKVAAALAEVPPGPNMEAERKAVRRKFLNEGPTTSDYSAHLNKPEMDGIFKERARIGKQNIEKRKRAAAKKRGENINFRRDKCSGDPKITA